MKRQYKVLIIEDEFQILEFLEKVLKLNGYNVVKAYNGIDGINKAYQELPDVIICDIMMPKKNGYEVLNEIRSNHVTSLIPVIMLTAKSHKLDFRTGMNSGADDYLTKPFDLDDLLKSINNVLNKKSQIDKKYSALLEELRYSIRTNLPHEMRTPLNVILTHSALLANMDKYEDTERIREMLVAINDSAKRINRTSENHLLYSILETRSKEEKEKILNETIYVDKDIITNLAEIQLNNYNRSEDLIVSSPSVEIKLPASYFKKIITELLDNAAKFSPDGSRITIFCRTDDNYFKIKVRDLGRGMDKSKIEQIGAYIQFDRKYYEQQGVGLGLFLVKKIISIADGYFNIDSVPNEGTTVEIWIPIINNGL